MVLGIMLGVGVVVAIDLANESASKAFDLSTEAVAGKATHIISGSPPGLDEDIYVDLKGVGTSHPMAPVVTQYVASPQLGELPLQLLGIDPFAEAPFRSYLSSDGDNLSLQALTDFLTVPGAVLISSDLAQRFSLAPGSRLTLEIGGLSQEAQVVGLINPNDDLSRRGLNSLILADIATAQELTRQTGTLDRIDLILPEDDPDAIESIRQRLPAGVTLQPTSARSGAITQMTAAFRTNLTALSLLALVVGVFLIYNTMTFSVVRRREMFGTLRTLGLTRREIFLLVLQEAFLVSVIGSVLGIGLGLLLGQGAVRLVTQTINDLFFTLTVQDIAVPYLSIVKGALIGLAATVTAAALPAWEAASITPRQALLRSGLEDKTRRMVRYASWVGVVMATIGAGIFLVPTPSLVVGFTGTFLVIIGIAILTPGVTRLVMDSLHQIANSRGNVLVRLAPRQVIGSLSRTSIAIAALMIALSVSIGVNLMISSFRLTVINWMDQILSGDVYIGPPGSLSLTDLSIEPEVIDLVEDYPGVVRADILRSVTVDSPNGPINIGANNNPVDGAEQIYLWVDGPPLEAWEKVQNGAILVSEPLARRLGLPLRGGSLTLFTDRGPHEFTIAGIYYDYSSSQGAVIMWLEQYRHFWEDDGITAAALMLTPGTDADQVVERLQQEILPVQSLLIRPNRELRAATLEVFDRTFAITGALQVLTTLVAFIGVVSAMLSLQLEKQRQLGLMRALGMTVRQLWRLVILETGLMGAVAGVIAMPTGYILSLILVFIINRRSFGWTLQMQVQPDPFIQALLVAIAAALLAGLYPAWRVGRREAADALRFE
jgi:putative ABC transport system permease protein